MHVALQVLGMFAVAAGAALVFGLGGGLIVGGVEAVVVGVVRELEGLRAPAGDG